MKLIDPVMVDAVSFYDSVYSGPRVRTLHREGDGSLSCDVPARFVLTLPAGRAVGVHGAIVSAGDELLLPLSPEFEGLRRIPGGHSVSTRLRLPRPLRVPGTMAVLATLADSYFSHWMMDMLPRVKLLREAGYDPAELDAVYLRAPQAPYEIASLEAAGVPIDRIIDPREHPHVCAERLVVPSTLREVFEATPLSCDYLDGLFGLPDVQPSTRLYVSRRGTSYRRIVNEEEVLEALAPHGFTSIVPETLTLTEQARAFAGAEVVVGPLGSAVMNQIYCRPGTAVVEIQNTRTTHTCGLGIASTRGQRYALAYARGVDPTATPLEEDLEIDPVKLLRALELLGV